MDPGAERQVARLVSPEVQPIGLGEARGVAVRRAEETEDEAPLRDRNASDLRVARRHPARPLDRAVVAQELLDRAGQEARIVLESPPLLRMPEEGEEPVPDEVHGRLVAGDVEEDAGREQLALRQPVPRLLRLDEPAQEVGPGCRRRSSLRLAEVVRHRRRRAAPALDHLGADRQRDGVERARHVPRPLLDRLAVARRERPGAPRSPSPATGRPAPRSRPSAARRPRDRAGGPRWPGCAPGASPRREA